MHHWQDIVFTIGSLVFTVALWPSIRSKHKPALHTSVITASVLFVFAITYLSLSLYFSAFATLLTTIAWTVLAVQKYRQPK
ncbi:MAG: hypothetical protein ABI221_01715 [Candidatus Saccharimonadales bacterium]